MGVNESDVSTADASLGRNRNVAIFFIVENVDGELIRLFYCIDMDATM